MSPLQLSLLAAGAVLIVLVIVYNVWTERRARKRAERAFEGNAGDALFAEPQRREPTLGMLPADDLGPESTPVSTGEPAVRVPPQELEAPGGPSAEISSRIDTVAVILSDDPVMAEQLEPLHQALQSHTTPVHIEGIVDEQWHPVESSPHQSWRELRVGLQLASRQGPLAEDELERFNRAIADFAASVNAVSQREAPATAAARARELDRFCADADIEVAVNVIGQFGATFAIARVKALALDNGLSETASGDLVRYTPDGDVGFVIRRFEDAHAKPNASYYAGLTFALDLPNVADASRVLSEMVRVAEIFATTLAGQLVDDNRKPLSEAGIAIIRRSLEGIVKDMEAHGIPAGSALARRLFS
jgi:FtsZ-interacting cell division protein ZipA